MKNQDVTLENKTNLKIEKNQEINFDEFESLLEFGDSSSNKKDNKIKEKNIPLDTKVSINNETKKETKISIDENIDFSMFDALLKEFEKTEEKQEVKRTKKRIISHEKIIKYLKKEIVYYEKKIDTIYKLTNLEIEEKNLFSLKEKLEKLKYDFSKLQEDDKDFSNLFRTCKKEILSLEKILQKKDLKEINDNFDYDLNIREFELKVKDIGEDINNNICFNMIKRMMFNLFKMNVGLYTIENANEDYKKITVGSFLVVNGILGIKEAISLKFNKSIYYKQIDYIDKINNKSDSLKLANKLLNKSLFNLEELNTEFKLNFSNYKNYIDDYEEIYFKINKIKLILDSKCEQLKCLIDNLNGIEV